MLNLFGPNAVAVIEALVSALFIISGTMKVIDLPAFTAAVRRYGLGRASAVEWTAKVVPAAELGTGVLLFARWHEVIWLFVSLVLVGVLSVVLLVKLIQGRRVPCGCFGGTDETLVGWWGLIRNVVLLALVVGDITARFDGIENELITSEWMLLFAAGAAFWMSGAQISLALKTFQRPTDT